MDLEEYFFLNDLGIDANKINLPEFNETEKASIDCYMETSRHLQEIDQLFHIFQFNLDNIFNHYQITNDDFLIPKNVLYGNQDDNIVINALIISYLSSAKTLIVSIEDFMKNNFGDHSEKYLSFKDNCLSKTYDNNFYYRLLLRIRDFCQHGHLPVTVDFNNYSCFDLQHILYTPHFNHNTKLKNEIKKIIDDLHKLYCNYPQISFSQAIKKFNICIIQIYVEFLNNIEEVIINSRREIELLLKKRKEIIYKSSDALNGFVFYDSYNESLHCFNPKENPVEMFFNIKNYVSKLLSEHTKNA